MFLNPKNKGFTLIEMMVAISIFSIIMVMSMGAVISIMDANRKSRSLKSAMNNLNLAVETMSRNVKFGTRWTCNDLEASCVGGVRIMFQDRFTLNGTLQTVTYQFVENGGLGRIERKIVGGPNDTNNQFESLTSPEIDINSFSLDVSGVGNDNKQPFLIMKVRGVVGVKASNQTQFDLQTAVSQREPEE